MNILIDITVGFYQRRLLSGIFEFFGDRTDVDLFIPEFPLALQGVPDPIDGVFSGLHGGDAIRRAAKAGTPVVNLTSRPFANSVQVCMDNAAILRMAFAHFRECNMHTLAFLHAGSRWLANERLRIFTKVCREAGVPLHVLRGFDMHTEPAAQSPDFLSALAELPKPAAVLLPVDSIAAAFMECCRHLKLRLPKDVQILGINNEPRLCASCTPTLSSIDLCPERVGFEGARALASLIAGNTIDPISRIPPAELIQRGSTSPNTGFSPIVDRAIAFMHANLRQRIEMADLVALADTGRRYLENRFAEELGCSPMRHLRAIRLQRISFLLKTTDMTVTEIGRQCGIPDVTYLCRLFRRHYGVTPQQYREQR